MNVQTLERLVCPKGCGVSAPVQPRRGTVVSHNCGKVRRMVELVPQCAIVERGSDADRKGMT